MDAIILAGGKGTRLKEVVSDVPKSLAPINGIPFLDFLIANLQSNEEIDKIILSVGYKKEKIIDRYSNLKNINFSEEDSPLGTGGAVKQALNCATSNDVLVLNGDTYIEFSLKNFLKFHLKKKSDFTLLSSFQNDLSRYGSLNIDDRTQKILAFEEKTKKNEGYINSGVYLINKNVFNNFLSNDSFSLEKDFFPLVLATKNIFGFKTNSLFIDIGTKASYLQAQKLFNTG